MNKESRRARKMAWRERKTVWAVVAVRIGTQAWVKLTPDARALENRLGFMLRHGGGAGLAPGMREAARAGGALALDVLEELEADLSAMARERVAAERLAHWAETLGAETF